MGLLFDDTNPESSAFGLSFSNSIIRTGLGTSLLAGGFVAERLWAVVVGLLGAGLSGDGVVVLDSAKLNGEALLLSSLPIDMGLGVSKARGSILGV